MATINVSLPSDGTTAEVADYNTPINTIVSEINGNLDNANIKSGAAISGSKLADNSIDLTSKASSFDGWIKVSDSWSYASATSVTVPSDATIKYSVGDKVKFSQTSTKYFYITAVTTTTLTLNGGSDYTLANAAISDIYYSKASTPLGFPDYFYFTPAYNNITVGSGTNTGRLTMRGKQVVVRTRFVYGSGSSVGSSFTQTLPITASSSSYVNAASVLGNATFVDSGTATNYGVVRWISTTTVDAIVMNAASTYIVANGVTSTVPFTWTTSDELLMDYVYEAA